MRLHAAAVLFALLFLPTLAATQGIQETQLTLVCRLGNDQIGYRDRNLTIDLRSNTVNGVPATITQGQIGWADESDTQTLQDSVNRYTGAMAIVGTDKKTGFTVMVTGSCVRASERKF